MARSRCDKNWTGPKKVCEFVREIEESNASPSPKSPESPILYSRGKFCRGQPSPPPSCFCFVLPLFYFSSATYRPPWKSIRFYSLLFDYGLGGRNGPGKMLPTRAGVFVSHCRNAI